MTASVHRLSHCPFYWKPLLQVDGSFPCSFNHHSIHVAKQLVVLQEDMGRRFSPLAASAATFTVGCREATKVAAEVLDGQRKNNLLLRQRTVPLGHAVLGS